MNNFFYIQSVEIKGLWGKKDVCWKSLYPDVNILVGINGSGKTTLLNMMEAYYCNNKDLKKYKGEFIGNPSPSKVYPVTYIRSFDSPVLDKRKSETPLMQELKQVVYQNNDGVSLFNYRMKMLDYPKEASNIQKRINQLFDIIDKLFSETRKTVRFSKKNNSELEFVQDKDVITLDELSSGEKQLLIVLLKVFLLEEKPAVILMDEPEISMHISWQSQLISIIRQLNPKSQLIISTHSPSIFGKGWGDKLTFMDELYK
ncbi:AAA family ATPase [uncultured Parabacteroides sp.]|uniref:AAA family ATPase n=1 Tax=uncultured Parabacteroides sp. TaxID=512312 RepID=UPI0025979849|nr:AAA family ATPase [uncultured Parabacteroides sp.]